MDRSKESIEASLILSATSSETEDDNPFTPHVQPVGKGICLTITSVSDDDFLSVSDHTQSFTGTVATLPISEESMRTARSLQLNEGVSECIHHSASTSMIPAQTNGYPHSRFNQERDHQEDEEDDIYHSAEMRKPGGENGMISGVGNEDEGTVQDMVPNHTTRRFPPQPMSMEEQIERHEETIEMLRGQLSKALTGDLNTMKLIDENVYYKQKVEELNAYIDQIDVEAEQEFGSLCAEVEELNRLVEEKSQAVSVLESRFHEKDDAHRGANVSMDALKATNMRQKEIIENMREDLDIQREKNDERNVAWERMADEMEDLKRKMRDDKDEFRRKELLFACELDDVQLQLNKQREILQAGSVSEIIQKWDDKILVLENELRERDSIIYTQQHLINEMRKKISTQHLPLPQKH